MSWNWRDGADGSRNLSAQVSLLYLNTPVQLHRGDAVIAVEATHERDVEADAHSWQQDE